MTARTTCAAVLLAWIGGASWAGCLGSFAVNYAGISSGPVGCPPGEISIANVQVVQYVHSWQATCRGRRYFCSGAGDQLSCTPEAPPPGWTPTDAAAVAPLANPAAIPAPVASAAASVTVVVVAPDAGAASDGSVMTDPALRGAPERTEIQSAMTAARDGVAACVGGVPSSVRTQIDFRGNTGRVSRVTALVIR